MILPPLVSVLCIDYHLIRVTKLIFKLSHLNLPLSEWTRCSCAVTTVATVEVCNGALVVNLVSVRSIEPNQIWRRNQCDQMLRLKGAQILP